ncbi:MAG: S49 family peptidase [Fibromonadaceae bacterium]|jgi:signal peptide peptidase SppA|nr:S49 family peptidase [Fibromonadaceae bacterium]
MIKAKFEKPTVIFFESSVFPESLDYLEAELRNAFASDCDAVVLAIRSYGGYSYKLPEMSRLIDKVAKDKPVFAYTDTVMASAAYWIGACADRVYIAPSAIVGAVGAYSELYDFSKYYEKQGIEYMLFRAGEDKARIGFDGQMRDTDKAELQTDVEESWKEFKSCILAHRKIDDAHLQGKVFSGDKALKLGFVDGFFDSIYDLVDTLKTGGIE